MAGTVSPFGDRVAEAPLPSNEAQLRTPDMDVQAPASPFGDRVTSSEKPPLPVADPYKEWSDTADLLKYRAESGISEPTSREVLQYKMLHPELPYETIAANLDRLRLQAQSSNTDWKALAQQHPVMSAYIQRDPQTMHLALGQAAALQYIQTYLGGPAPYGTEPELSGLDQSLIKYTPVPTAVSGLGEQMWHGFNYGTAKALYGFGQMFATAFAQADDKIGETIFGKKNQGVWWRGMAAYYKDRADFNGSLAHVDVHGDSLKNSSEIVKGIAGVSDATASFLPYAMELLATEIGSGGAATPFLFNTIMQAGEVFRGAKAKGATDNQALGRTAVGAPLLGEVMSLSPLSRAGRAFSTAATDAAIEKIVAGQMPSMARAAWTTLARGGIDAMSGQVALGLQGATLQLATAGSDKDMAEVPKEFFRGLADPSLLGFHAFGMLSTVGKIARSAEGVRQFDQLIKTLESANPDAAETTMREDAARRVAAQRQAFPGVYYPLQEFLSEAERTGQDPREMATKLMNDGGAAYDVALATRSEHLFVQPERIEHVLRSDIGESFKEHGKFDQTLHSRNELQEQVTATLKDFEEEYAKAAKIDPENLKPDDAPLYKAAAGLTALVTHEGVKIPNIIAEVRTMAKRRPDMTHAEIFDSLYGRNGVYGAEARGKKDVPAPQRLIELAKHLTGNADERWFTAFKEEQAQQSAKDASTKADDAAFEAIKQALVSNDQRFMEGARDEALAKAKKTLDADPVVKIARITRGDWEGVTPEQKPELTRPDGKPYRLHDQEVAALLGPDKAKALAEKYPKLVTKNARNAISVDAAAQILGYKPEPGDLPHRHFLRDLLNAPDEKKALEDLTQAHLDQRYGPDLLNNPEALMGAALDATHTPQATDRLLGLYRQLANQLDPVTKARSAMTSGLWHEHAERLLGLKLLGEIDPHHFAEAEGRAVKQAFDVLDGSKGDDGARRAAGARHVESALLYHHLYLAAREAVDTLGGAKRQLARSASSDLPVKRLGFADTTDKTIQDDGMNTYQRARNGALAALGLLKAVPGADYSGAAAAVVERANDLGQHAFLSAGFTWHPETIQRVIDGQSGWSKLTPDEARQIHSFVRNLDNLGAKLGERAVADDPQRISDAIEEFQTNGGLRAPKFPLPADKNVGVVEKAAGVMGALREIGRPFNAFAKMMGWNNTPSNWQVTLLLQHLGPEGDKLAAKLQQAIIDRRELMNTLYKPWREIYDRTMADPKMFKVAEGAYESLAPGDMGQADGKQITYAWLMNLARWYGDADGRNRVLKSFKMIPDNVEKTLAKYLSREDLANVQAEKDLIEKEWFPRLAQKQLERTGEPLRRSQSAPFTINDVEYKGGHVTLSYDDRAGMGLDPRRALNDATLGSFKHDAVGYHRATMESGFLQERSGPAVGQHPDLSSLTAPQTMADMAHHLAVGDFLLTANQALLNPHTAGVIARYMGGSAVEAIQGWLMRTSSEMRGGPERIDPGTRESMKAMREVRNAVVLATVAGKVTIPLAHATHPFMVGVMEHGWGYAAKYTAPAFTEMMNSLPNWLATGTNEYVERMQAESAYLRQRSSDTPQDLSNLYFERELAQAGAPKSAIMKMKEGVETFGTMPLRAMDDIFSATIYQARKQHALDADMSEMEAVKAAEQEVFKAMPNFALHARSGFSSTKTGVSSVITPFMGYYATVRDLHRAGVFERVDKAIRARETATGQEAPLWYRAAQGAEWKAKLAVPVILGLSLGAFLKGSGPKEQQDLPDYATANAGYWQRDYGSAMGSMALDAGRESIIRMSELYPMLGHAAEPVADWARNKIMEEKVAPMRGQTNILFSPFDSFGKAGYQTASDRFGPGDAALAWGKALAPAMELPVAPIANVGGMAVNFAEYLDQLPTSKTARMLDFNDRMIYPKYYGKSAKYQAVTPLSLLRDAVDEAVRTDKGGQHKLPW